jgi:hypothetical protein
MHSKMLRALAFLTVAAAACWPATSSTALADQVNTFKGTCLADPVIGYWPQPLKFVPQNGDFIATPQGGSCTGTLNGQQVQNVPLAGRVEMRGIQSCGQAVIDGRAYTTIGGKNFYADVSERRAGREAAIVALGDAGGQMVLKAYGRVGLIKDGDPLASDPVLRPFAEPMDLSEFTAACVGPGLSRISILIQIATAPTGVSSPTQE